ncbi:hypothetical protein MLD38_004641 [Melastoma candidum]|uniref:Uncharacterized protein n=1 Tax=Melastoma candidum TaxID=119954 RepID=A0ACB9SA87_9MYRT|nr:hypothetical protein MLD38_004641 [Melastoma candidum]
MSLKRTLAQRLLSLSRPTSLRRHYTMSRANRGPSRSTVDHDPGDESLARRFIQRRAAAFQPEPRPMQDGLLKRLGLPGLDRDHGRNFPFWSTAPVADMAADNARKLLRVAQMEMAKSRLREMPEAWIGYEEFVRVCGSGSSDPGQGALVARMLDESGHVVVLGDHVLLRPELVRKAIEGLMPTNDEIRPDDPRREEFEAMEVERMTIHAIAEAGVKRELWCGLGFLVAQTAAFMRLTFWELTWDVMEPICFYLTSVYFMAGYAFFLRTAREPSFEGFFQSRFATKRKRLMDSRGFDLRRYEELRRVFGPRSSSAVPLPRLPFGSDVELDSICK